MVLATFLKWTGSIIVGASAGVLLTWLTLWCYARYLKMNDTVVSHDDGANTLSNILIFGGIGFVLLGAIIGAWLYYRHHKKNLADALPGSRV